MQDIDRPAAAMYGMTKKFTFIALLFAAGASHANAPPAMH
jgi:hypothetical protein